MFQSIASSDQHDRLPSLQMKEYAEQTADDILEANINPTTPVEEWKLESLHAKMLQYCPIMAGDGQQGLTVDDLKAAAGQGGAAGFEGLRDFMRRAGVQAYEMKRTFVEGIDEGLMYEAERFFLLRNIDQLWKEHLQAIKFVQQAVGLRGYAQRDPLTEFKLESYKLYRDMMAQVRAAVRPIARAVFRPVVMSLVGPTPSTAHGATGMLLPPRRRVEPRLEPPSEARTLRTPPS